MADVRQSHLSMEIFFSYSHKDEQLRDELANHLSLLQRQGLITAWHDRKIGAGMEWSGEIDQHLKKAHIILLLISADFLASDYCYDIELKLALERHKAGECRVIPVILRPVDWQAAPFGKLQALPKDAQPITLWPNRDEALAYIARSIRTTVEELIQRPSTQRLPSHNQQGLLGISINQPSGGVKPVISEQVAHSNAVVTPVSLPQEPKCEEKIDNSYFTRLEDFLKIGNWKEADQETARVMLLIARRAENRLLLARDIEHFPCLAIEAIDALWREYSNYRFGFGVQRQIWRAVGGQPRKFDIETFVSFGDRVGWRINGEWLRIYNDLSFTPDAPAGHLPSLRLAAPEDATYELGAWRSHFKGLILRMETCFATQAP